MTLLPPALRALLLINGAAEPDTDHVPVVKFFNPVGAGRWLVTEMDADGDTLCGLADLGEPELGSFSLAEIEAARLPFGLTIERDLHFTTGFPLSVWARGRRAALGSISAAEALLRVIARRDGRRVVTARPDLILKFRAPGTSPTPDDRANPGASPVPPAAWTASRAGPVPPPGDKEQSL
jgi:hypothetical protein